jgi:hypothetical protein
MHTSPYNNPSTFHLGIRDCFTQGLIKLKYSARKSGKKDIPGESGKVRATDESALKKLELGQGTV